ncbi:Uncharacterized protein BP5553_07081 [Venustampulla echinocandica]|uniref:F-box domain-containing protein n=1 Tax=Venustampulla echinocandica TaxID=2656787 RepID=A0A370TII5_9HELO|nr:Uncharacterized protein BP5553_07081 [Venustampulla echinocandica]RDL35150.1 Uncharacterized protein BP5553_07081 [Venustampulla echinocandica]
MLRLPADVLALICEELGNRQDFGVLFSCALAGKSLMHPALRWLYRIHNQSPIITSEGNDAPWTSSQDLTFDDRRDVQRNTVAKWALMWKSIIGSSLEDTAYPYCLYIRVLDLRNLSDLLNDPVFHNVALDSFFDGDMAQFLNGQDRPVKKKTRLSKTTYTRLNVPLILDAIGEAITGFVSQAASESKTTVALEDLSGDINASALPIWVGRLSKLKSMTLWDGSVLDKNVAMSIADKCPNFDDLTFYFCPPLQNIDQRLASFFSGLRVNSLRSFSALGAAAIGPETLLSLNRHAKSLRMLKLDGLKADAIKNLSLLKDCDALEIIDLHDAEGRINLEITENVVFLDVVEWLGRCKCLRDLQFAALVSAPEIARQICLRDDIRLQRLVVHEYPLLNNQEFHKALLHQTSLESLDLKADPEGAFGDDINNLVESICHLTKLKDLKLISTSDYFKSREIIRIATHLPALQEFWFTGYEVTDDIWPAMSGLHDLRTLNILAVTSFSSNGILNFISTLRDSNRGLNLAILAQNPANKITGREQANIEQSLMKKVDGKFEFAPYREGDSDSESLSD